MKIAMRDGVTKRHLTDIARTERKTERRLLIAKHRSACRYSDAVVPSTTGDAFCGYFALGTQTYMVRVCA